ncbi:MAG: glutamate--tRNA ligase [Micavibrio sp.]|nr:MAG: glutamate--tRNA ligase [Micavibrio sp.]
MSVITRFAPSPTGYLHIGGARTALFNWLYARRHGGKFLLRIEDTDRARSTEDAIEKIYDGMKWLGLDWDGEAVSQFARRDRHAEIAQQLVAEGKAYYCYCTPEELEEMREKARAEGRSTTYDGRWRDRAPSEAPDGIPPVIRIKAPREGETVIQDAVQGEVRVENTQLDDMVLLRSDGTPTYMLSVVVDDYDMKITHIIRGNDHLTNTFRQIMIYDAMGWETPVFAHLPLIHGADGKKLSKRHGATGVESYREMGYLPEALRNYLLRLGWSHGDEEIIPTDKAVEWFDLEHIGQSAARFDFDKLDSLNAHYMAQTPHKELARMILPFLTEKLGHTPSDTAMQWIESGMGDLIERAKRLTELADEALFYAQPRPLPLTEKAGNILDDNARNRLADIKPQLKALDVFTAENIEAAVKAFIKENGLKFPEIGMPLRAALTGSGSSPSVTHIAAILGKEETLARLDDAIEQRRAAA